MRHKHLQRMLHPDEHHDGRSLLLCSGLEALSADQRRSRTKPR